MTMHSLSIRLSKDLEQRLKLIRPKNTMANHIRTAIHLYALGAAEMQAGRDRIRYETIDGAAKGEYTPTPIVPRDEWTYLTSIQCNDTLHKTLKQLKSNRSVSIQYLISDAIRLYLGWQDAKNGGAQLLLFYNRAAPEIWKAVAPSC